MRVAYVSSELPGTRDAGPDDTLAPLRALEDVAIVQGDGLGGLPDDAGEVEAIVTVLTDRVDAAALARLPALRVVANVAVGYDNVDVAACAARGVVVTNTPDVLTESTADLTFGLLLDAARRITEGDRVVRAGGFGGWTPTFMLGQRVGGQLLGIVGLGRIGRAVARRARGFGMRVLYSQRRRAPVEIERELDATWVPLVDLFRSADFVSLHCPSTAETRHLVDAARLASMKPGSVLVNTARGACVDEAALAHALAHGPLAAAGLDVYEKEPRVHPGLLELPNVVLAPHLGSADVPTRRAMARTAVENAAAVLAGRPPPNPVR